VAIRFDYLRGGRQVSLIGRSLLPVKPALTVVAALLAALPAGAQYPGQVAKTSQDVPVVRSVAVVEWTGDEGHPKTSRLVPVSVYDGQVLQDGGIYLAQPAPLALSGEVEYELKENGKTVGLFDINGAGQEQGSWIGFGVWKPLPKAKPAATKAAQSGSKEVWGEDTQSDRPTLHRKAHSGDASTSGTGNSGDNAGQSADPDRPTLHKKTSSDSSSDTSTASTTSSSASDPDRPTLHKKDTSDSSGDTTTSSTASSSTPADPDRPTLHKKTTSDSSSDTSTASTSSSSAPDPNRPTLKKKSGKKVEDVGYVESLPDSTASDRPRLMRGKPAEQGGSVLPTLMGLPPDMHQAVAVSDAKNRPEHLWSYSWSNPDDEAKMKADLEDIARKALGLTPILPPAVSAPKRTTTTAHRKTKPAPAPPPPAPLVDEQFRVFELAYGSGATMVLTAHTDGQGAQQKFVTLVAQPDLYGKVVVLLKNVTDAAHLDDTPRMRLVDAVDAMADNRGELLFELRGATQRQFALYRVLRGQADKLFVSGPGAIASPVNE
jgi:hypothetical protein